MIKNYLLFAVLTLAAMSCNKDQNSVATAITSNSDELVSDRGPNCPTVEIRLDAPTVGYFSERYEVQVYREFTNLIWDKYAASFECFDSPFDPNKVIQVGHWYPITLLDYEQYELRFTFKHPCHSYFPNTGSVTIRFGGISQTTFPFQTTDAMVTDHVYFYRAGCNVYEGLIE